jgi:ribosomal peptide maturation radical SAM protein 1
MDVAFVVVPFADIERPAMGVSLLKSEVAERGFSATVQYINFDLAELIGADIYTTISEHLPSESLVGEWFFADVVFEEGLPPEFDYLAKFLPRYASNLLIRDIQKARQIRHRFIDEAVNKIAALNARVVGFTTTFHQTCCSLAMAKRLRQLADPPVIVFGGANCEGEMGLQLLHSFPWIDYVCTREGDEVFPQFITRLLRENDPAPIPGILKQGSSEELTTPPLVFDLDRLPVPDYSDYFARYRIAPGEMNIQPELLVETSRGCWWGAKNHCTFCGLNGETMRFRGKTTDRVFAEFVSLSETYGIKKINCVDNILDFKLGETLFPRLKNSGLDLKLFYEVKANMKRSQIASLQQGGVYAIQPGIESFSNLVLRIMNKGCTALHNIQLLRWCEEAGISVLWNLLAGFPGEPEEEYAKMADLIPLLTHLQPPTGCAPIRLDRFSPLFVQAERHGLRRVRPMPAYYYVYPLGRRELARLAYFFDFDYPDGRNPNSYITALKQAVDSWIVAHSGKPEELPKLDAVATADGDVYITDTRPCAVQTNYRLQGVAGEIYRHCDAAKTGDQLHESLGGPVTLAEIASLLEELQSNKLIIQMDGRYLSLAVMRLDASQSAKATSDVDARITQTSAAESFLHSL